MFPATIETARLTLRAPCNRDAEIIFQAYAQDAEVARYLVRIPHRATCDAENNASARAMEKAGLTREGMLRRYIVHPNVSSEPRDSYMYAVTR